MPALLDYCGPDNFRLISRAVLLLGSLTRFKMMKEAFDIADNAENSLLAKNVYYNAAILICLNVINMYIIGTVDPVVDYEFIIRFICCSVLICHIINRENESISRINELIKRGRIVYDQELNFRHSKTIKCQSNENIWCECSECKKCEF